MYGASLIKKKKYWPKCAPGAVIDAHFEDKDVNHCEILEEPIDGFTFQVIYMKQPNCVIKIMYRWMALDNFEVGTNTARLYFGRPQDNQAFLLYAAVWDAL